MVMIALREKLTQEEALKNRETIRDVLGTLRSQHSEIMEYIHNHMGEGMIFSRLGLSDALDSLERAVAANNDEGIVESSRAVQNWVDAFRTLTDLEEDLEKQICHLQFASQYLQLARIKIQISHLTHAHRSSY